jgi:hypothetical protein
VDYGVTDNVDLYGILGYQNMKLTMTGDGDFERSHINALLWGVGAKATFFRADNGLYFGGNLMFTHAYSKHFDFNHEDWESRWSELNVRADLHAGWNFKDLGLTPYLGVEYLWGMGYVKHPSGSSYDDCGYPDLKREHNVGAFVGLDYALNDKLFVNLEGNMINRWGGSASLGYKFDVSDFSLAGSGSDTIGACNLVPQLRYSFMENEYDQRNDDWTRDEWAVRSHSGYFQLNYGVTDNVDVYGLIGYKQVYIKSTKNDYDAKFDSFLWGAGAKVTFFRAKNGLYAGTNFLFTQSIKDNHNEFQGYNTSWNELNVVWDVYAGWHFEKLGLTPYAGVEYLWNMAYVERVYTYDNDEVDCASFFFNQPHPVGVYVGVDYLINDKLYINLEGNMINRWGGTVGIGYKFDICGKPAPAPAPATAPVLEPKLEPMSKN